MGVPVKPITIFARMAIRPENVEQVSALAVEGCKVAAGEPGTLAYDWHYSPEQGALVLLESYADSDAHFAHMQAEGHGEFMGRLMALIDSVEFVVLGEPTAEHAAALASVPGAQFFQEVARI
ncbi:MAG: Antibiotic biosynthesis monooxygenase [Actinomycetota bacterium]|jgi:quinol monooxygenase YgiN